MSRLGTFGGRLYRGEISFDFVGRQKLWYAISGAILSCHKCFIDQNGRCHRRGPATLHRSGSTLWGASGLRVKREHSRGCYSPLLERFWIPNRILVGPFRRC